MFLERQRENIGAHTFIYIYMKMYSYLYTHIEMCMNEHIYTCICEYTHVCIIPSFVLYFCVYFKTYSRFLYHDT